VNRISGRLAINLVNTAGPHTDPNVYTLDEIPPAGPLEITIRAKAKPARILLEPGGKEMNYGWMDGEVRLILPELEIHAVIVVE
jgi:hypothetical protein